MKDLIKILFTFFCFSNLLLAQTQLEIGNNLVVETSGGIYAIIDGDLNEVGSGYFKGKISSGDRTGLTSFAGMTLSVGIEGSIIRTTGSAYAKGNGEGANFLRYYEVNNNGGMATADMQISFISAGSYDERNSLTDPYYIYRYQSNWNGYGAGASSSPVSGSGIHILSGVTDWVLSDSSFILFNDSEVANTGTPILFNESGEGGDGHDVEMTFSDLTGSGNVTVQQTNRAPSNLLNNRCLTYFWEVSKDPGITAFATDVSIKYLDSDLLDVTESHLVVAYYDDIFSEWVVLQDDTLDKQNNIITVHNLDHFTTFAVGEPDAFRIPIVLDAKIFLEGPFHSDTMSTAISGSIPLSQPYNGSPWNYSGRESVSSIPAGVVDWILIELRSSTEASSVIAKRAAFLKSDGSVVDLDGGGSMILASSNMKRKMKSNESMSFLAANDGRKDFERAPVQPVEKKVWSTANSPNKLSAVENSASPVKFYVPGGDYYIVIYHRNHLSIMSAAAQTINSSSALYDFTSGTGQYYGGDAKQLGSGAYGMYAGDGQSDGDVDASDINLVWRPQNGTGWSYSKFGDYDMDGDIDASDINLKWRPNNGKGTQVPLNVAVFPLLKIKSDDTVNKNMEISPPK